jgi:hypothetical protein
MKVLFLHQSYLGAWYPGEAAAELAVAFDPPSNHVQLATSSTAIGAYPRAIQRYGNLPSAGDRLAARTVFVVLGPICCAPRAAPSVRWQTELVWQTRIL